MHTPTILFTLPFLRANVFVLTTILSLWCVGFYVCKNVDDLL